MGVDPGSGNQFTEFIHLTPPSVKSGELNSLYIYLHYVDVAYPYTRSMSDHTIKLYTEVDLLANSGILLVFPSEYTDTMIITSQLDCYVILDTGETSNLQYCDVSGRGVTVLLESFEIEAYSYF